MVRRRKRRSRSLAAQAIELGIAAPQVIALRALRMGDREERYRMGAEKVVAFNEAWNAMAGEAFRANQELALSYMQSLWFPWIRPKSSARSAARRILGKGLAPVRRRAVANARRLGRSRRK
jgi:hypothetical protein